MTNDRALLQAARETIASIVGKDIYQPAKASRGLKRKYHQGKLFFKCTHIVQNN